MIYAKGYDPDSGETDAALLSEAVRAAKEAQAAVIFAGLPESFETEGADRESPDIPANQNELISEVLKVQKNVVVVLHGGAAMALPWQDDVSAILCMYLGGDQVGRSALDLLYGKVNPSGKLAETWPLKVADNPSYLNFPGENGIVEYNEGIYIGYRYYDKKEMEVEYLFGHGLSYTSFEYSDLKLDKAQMTDSDRLTVTCRVKNTGSVFGKEVVQLYAGLQDSKVRRAVRELKGFEKIALKPGEEKVVSFTLDARAFAYYEPKIHDWFVESGSVTIGIGSSSRDIRLRGEVSVSGTMEIPVTVTLTTTIGEIMQTAKGRAFVGQMMALRNSGEQADTNGAADAMGAGADRMMQQMMMDMPLCALTSYGVMTSEQLRGLIAMLNS